MLAHSGGADISIQAFCDLCRMNITQAPNGARMHTTQRVIIIRKASQAMGFHLAPGLSKAIGDTIATTIPTIAAPMQRKVATASQIISQRFDNGTLPLLERRGG